MQLQGSVVLVTGALGCIGAWTNSAKNWMLRSGYTVGSPGSSWRVPPAHRVGAREGPPLSGLRSDQQSRRFRWPVKSRSRGND
jgi:hypothetical protein